MNFGDRLISILEQKNITKYELAKRIGMQRNSLNRIVRNEQIPSYNTILRICNGLEIRPKDFFDFDNQEGLFLSDYELELLKGIRDLDKEQKEAIQVIVNAINNNL